MANDIQHTVITVEFDTWQPFQREAQRELDALLGMLRSRELLAHCGNVKTTINDNLK